MVGNINYTKNGGINCHGLLLSFCHCVWLPYMEGRASLLELYIGLINGNLATGVFGLLDNVLCRDISSMVAWLCLDFVSVEVG